MYIKKYSYLLLSLSILLVIFSNFVSAVKMIPCDIFYTNADEIKSCREENAKIIEESEISRKKAIIIMSTSLLGMVISIIKIIVDKIRKKHYTKKLWLFYILMMAGLMILFFYGSSLYPPIY